MTGDPINNHAGVASFLSPSVIKSIFCLLGVGILLPWNAFVSAKPYFEARLCSGSDSFHGNVELWFGLVYNLSSVLSLACIIVLRWMHDAKDASPTEEASPPSIRSDPSDTDDAEGNSNDHSWWMVMIPLYVYLAVFLLTSLMVIITTISPTAFLGFTLLGLAICGVCTAFASAGIVGTAGLFPAHVGINPYFSGQAAGGLAVALANLLAALLRNPSPFLETNCEGYRRLLPNEENSCLPYHEVDWSSLSYFLLGSVVLGACIIGYSYIHEFQSLALVGSYATLAEVPNDALSPIEVSMRGNIELHDQRDIFDVDSDGRPDFMNGSPLPRDLMALSTHETTASVGNAIKGPAFAIFLTFFVTLSLFPGWISDLESVHQCESTLRIMNDLYTPIAFVVFNAGDLMGRLLAARIDTDRVHSLSEKLVILSLLRFLFFPLFLLCTARDSVWTFWIQSDLFSLSVQAAFAVLNGLLTSVSFMHAPTLLSSTATAQAKGSEILNFSLSFGLLCGSFFSFLFARVAIGHW